ncbi:hypothetical protein HETIRDRAFT_409794 [Heterobasidion irregulare TC 32-1]|uniref:Peptidase A1 domain-containing protein n=1 Tax=Heterobasidion irregulare (strain TC 32-1) TaxID=747525 RepID=W4K9B8_HETIT|nr:uncharacterized protein HETIRDRAFT_409794 [Heterobasidion irregulare TC 32-1]ETW82324.1 hypothetical protein HETIRDRAFT_409794 [Heterobasidion irregulare TC 32-1]
MGSSDLWVASRSCSSSACSNGVRSYDPSKATSTGATFSIQYLEGSVSGPIYWDSIQIGGYGIEFQALAAVTTVQDEPLERDFDGILGLALPLNSIIASILPPSTGNSPDGAVFASNLFGITPVGSAPAARFFSLALSRPDSPEVTSLLGIGQHPTALVPDPAKITYSPVIASNVGNKFWKTNVRGVTVYVDGQSRPLTLGRSHTGAVFPTAVLDSGVPYILTTTAIANGIYGALGIGPGADGQYYVPCTTPLNMTITLDGQPELPLHPLDVTAKPPNDATASTCLGLIQTASGQLDTSPTLDDMILGVPFLRNTYTVMAYDIPYTNGTFPNATAPLATDTIRPRLGLLGLTNATKALEEFNTVRVLNQPLSGQPTAKATQSSSGKKLSVGVEVLLGLVGFFALCVVLFAGRWYVGRRRWRRAGARDANAGDDKGGLPGYQLARRGSRESSDEDGVQQPSEDVLRLMRFEEYKRRMAVSSAYTMDSARTRVGGEDGEDGEFGLRKSKFGDALDDTGMGWRDTLVEDRPLSKGFGGGEAVTETTLMPRPRFGHQHTASDVGSSKDGGVGVTEPLLAHTRADSRALDDIGGLEMGLLGVGAGPGGVRGSMAGVGTAARSSRLDAEHRLSASSVGGGMGLGGERSSLPLPPSLPPSPASLRFPGIAVADDTTSLRVSAAPTVDTTASKEGTSGHEIES